MPRARQAVPAARKTRRQPLDRAIPENAARDWLPACEVEQHFDYYFSLYCYNQSSKTIEDKRNVLKLLLWFLEEKGHQKFDRFSAAAVLAHARNGHLEKGGRWG